MNLATKKIGLVIGALGVLAVAVILLVPLIVDVDKYRPRIVDAANEHINGKVELGKLSLSLWGQIRIEIAGLGVSDASGKPVMSVKDAYFHLPFMSVLGGSPSLVLVMNAPSVTVIKDSAGKLNLMSLAKESSAASPGAASPAPTSGNSAAGSQTAAGSAQPVALPAIATRARLGLEMKNAVISYHDASTGLDSQIHDFNVLLENVSLSRAASIHVWADLDTTMAKAFAVKGRVELQGTATPHLQGGKFDQLAVSAHLDLDPLDIAAGQAFHKAAGMAANADLAITASGKEVTIERLDAKFLDVELKSSGSITVVEGAPSSPVVHYKISSNDVDFKPWVELVPMLKEFELAGSARLDAEATGPLDKLGYQAHAKITGLTAKAPGLKAEPRIDFSADVETDQLKSLTLTFKAPANDLEIQGSLRSFSAPQGRFTVTSSGMDLDRLIEFPPKDAKSPASASSANAPAPGAPAATPNPKASADIDAGLASVRTNKSLAAMAIEIPVNMKMIKARDVKITDLSTRLVFRDLTAAIEHFSMKVWNGSVGADLSVGLKPPHPSYHLTTKVEGLDLKEAVESQLQLFKNTVIGTAYFDMTADGSSFNSDLAMRNLKASGKFHVDHAVFASIDVGKMVTDALNSGIQKVAEKVPQAKGKTVGGAPKGDARYQVISSSFQIADGKFTAPDFVAKAEPNMGIDIKGNTSVNLTDNSLQTNWEVIDTYNVTKARDLSLSQGGLNVPHILARGNDPVKFPIAAGCTIMQPCYSYAQVPDALAAVAMANVGDAMKGQAGDALKKHALQLLNPGGSQGTTSFPAIDALKKKFF